MPYPQEHACRLRSPKDFQPDSFRRVTREHKGKEYSIIMGRLKGQTTMTEQTYRYDKTKWTEDQAKAHCKEHEGTFEPALRTAAETAETSNWLPVAKKNMVKTLADGKKIIATEELLKNSVDSWKNGNITVNHKEPIPSLKILDAKYESPFLYMKLDAETEKLFRNTDATGWSVEFDSDSLKLDGNKIIGGNGVGLSVLYAPHIPTCTPEMGCNETCTFEMDFEGRTLSAKNEFELKTIAEDIKKGVDRLWSLLKGVKKEETKTGNLEKEKMDEIERKELTSQFEETMNAKIEELTTTHETEVKELKEKIAAFEQKEIEETKAKQDAQFEQIIAKLPPGMTHTDEDKAALRAKFDTDPTGLMLDLVSLEHKESTNEEGSEFDTESEEAQRIIETTHKEAGIGFEVI
jgi:hypothetical protein